MLVVIGTLNEPWPVEEVEDNEEGGDDGGSELFNLLCCQLILGDIYDWGYWG
jgi:hypothetical protein